MKFILFCLIGLFAFTTPAVCETHLDVPQPTDGLWDKIQEIVNIILENIDKVINEIKAKAEEIISKISEKIQDIVDKARDVLDQAVKKILDKLEEIAKQSEVAGKCVEENRPDVEAVIKNAQDGLEICTSNAIEQSNNILKNIESELKAIRENINDLTQVLEECVKDNRNPIKALLCISQKTDEIKNTLAELIKNARKALEVGIATAQEIALEASNCVTKVSNDAQEHLGKIMQDIENCINGKHLLLLN